MASIYQYHFPYSIIYTALFPALRYLLSLLQATKSLTVELVTRLKHIHTHFQYPYQVRRTRGELSRCTHFGGWLQGERETQLRERANPSEWVTLQQREENKMAGSFTPRLSRDSLGMLVGRQLHTQALKGQLGYEVRCLVDMFILDYWYY